LDSLGQETSAVAARMSTDMVYLFPFSGVLKSPGKQTNYLLLKRNEFSV